MASILCILQLPDAIYILQFINPSNELRLGDLQGIERFQRLQRKYTSQLEPITTRI